jgi:hypothetical protein
LEGKGTIKHVNYRDLLIETRRRRVVGIYDEKPKSRRPQVTIRKKPASFMDAFIKQINAVVYDFQCQKLGITSNEGIFTYDAETGESTINPIDFFSAPVPAYAMRTPLSEIKVGDIISVASNRCGFAIEISEKKDRIKVLYSTGAQGWIKPPTNVAFGAAAVMCVRNIFGGSEMNPMLLAMMASEGGDGEGMDPMALMMMSSMGNDKNPMMNMMLPMMLMQKGEFGLKDMAIFSAMQGGMPGMKMFPMATAEDEEKKSDDDTEG